MDLKAFAPTEHFEVDEQLLGTGTLSGIAAPRSGPLPCALKLVAGEMVLALSRATNFSSAAFESKVRLGWCGFGIGGVLQGLALHGDVELKCLVSGRTLGAWKGFDLAALVKPAARLRMTVTALRVRLANEGNCHDLRHVASFAVKLAQSEESRAVVNASYRYLLGRDIEAGAPAHDNKDFTDEMVLLAFWDEIAASEEFKRRGATAFMSPFDTSFPFPREYLDA